VLLEVKNSPFFLSMPIHFVCSCGKHLKARRRLAGWISFCPACGEHVVIPTGKATHSGIAEIGKPAPVVDSSMMSELPGECQPGLLVAPADDSVGRRSQAAAASSGRAPGATVGANHPADSGNVLFRRRSKSAIAPRRQKPDFRWSESVYYTLPLCRRLVVLAVALAFTSGLAYSALPALLQPDTSVHTRSWIVPCAALLAVLIVYSGALLSGVLALSTNGSLRVVGRPKTDDLIVALVQWTASFAAGPALFLVPAAIYWLHFGDPTLVDRLILAELIAAAGIAWTAALLTMSQPGGYKRLHPAALVRTIALLGWRFSFLSMAFAAAMFGLGLFGAFAFSRLHNSPFQGFLCLGLFWLAALTLAAFAFRRLGLSYYGANGRDRVV